MAKTRSDNGHRQHRTRLEPSIHSGCRHGPAEPRSPLSEPVETLPRRSLSARAASSPSRKPPTGADKRNDRRDQQDVLNSNILAWLSASKIADPFKEPPTAWYTQYRTVLNNVGWVTSDFIFAPFTPDGRRFTLRDVATDYGDPEGALAITALTELPADSAPAVTFNRHSHSSVCTSLQTILVTPSGPDLVANWTSYTVTTTDSIPEDVLPFEFKAATTQVAISTQTAQLNEGIYGGQMRESVQTKLGYIACPYISQFDP